MLNECNIVCLLVNDSRSRVYLRVTSPCRARVMRLDNCPPGEQPQIRITVAVMPLSWNAYGHTPHRQLINEWQVM